MIHYRRGKEVGKRRRWFENGEFIDPDQPAELKACRESDGEDQDRLDDDAWLKGSPADEADTDPLQINRATFRPPAETPWEAEGLSEDSWKELKEEQAYWRKA